MDLSERPDLRTLLSYFPFTVVTIAVVGGLLAANDVRLFDVFARSAWNLVNPVYHVGNLLLHEEWAHYQSNMLLFVPLGVLLTLLTSDRHVLGLVIVSHALASVIHSATQFSFGVGSSAAVMAVAAAALVRLTGDTLRNTSMETLQAAVVGVLVPLLVALYILVILLGGGRIGHFAHFLGFLFGGAYEAMYVFGDREGDGRTQRRELLHR